MTDSSPEPSADNDNTDDTAHARWRFIGDVLVLQLKLLLGNLYTLVLIPATLGAAALDLLFKTERHGERFYRVIVSQIEAVVAREYAKGGTAASVKAAVDQALDALHAKTDKGAAKARAAAQRLAEKIRPPSPSA